MLFSSASSSSRPRPVAPSQHQHHLRSSRHSLLGQLHSPADATSLRLLLTPCAFHVTRFAYLVHLLRDDQYNLPAIPASLSLTISVPQSRRQIKVSSAVTSQRPRSFHLLLNSTAIAPCFSFLNRTIGDNHDDWLPRLSQHSSRGLEGISEHSFIAVCSLA